MLVLKLNLPTATINYNKVGSMTSAAVPFVPERVKATQLDLEITGYQAPTTFFAFKLTSPDRALSLEEQFALLHTLGFKTVPTYPNDAHIIDTLIRVKARYGEYGAIWWDTARDGEYKLPYLTTITAAEYKVDPAGRVFRQLTTHDGVYDVLDQRTPEYYQVGLQVKVWNGEVQPYVSGPIIDPVPTKCPKCNNPLKVLQLANDLPRVLKCVNPVCKLMRTTDESLEAEGPVVDTEEPDAPVAVEPVETANDTPTIEDTTPTADNAQEETKSDKLVVLNLEVKLPKRVRDKIIEITSTDAIETASKKPSVVVTKTTRSVTRVSRNASSKYNIPLCPVNELEKLVDGDLTALTVINEGGNGNE